MGATSTTAITAIKQYVETDIKNNTSISVLNENINTSISNSATNVANLCVTEAYVKQSALFKNIHAVRDINFDLHMDLSQYADFTCVQTVDIVQKAQTKLINQMHDAITTNIATDIISKLVAQATANAQAQKPAITLPGGSTNTTSKTDIETIVKNNITNNINVNLRNIIKTVVVTNITIDSMQSCVQNAKANQSAGGMNFDAGRDVNILVNMNANQTMFGKCKQMSNITSDILADFANITGIAVYSDVKSKIDQQIKDIGSSITKFIEKLFGNLFGGLFSGLKGLTGIIIGGSVLSCCCIVVIIIIFASIKIFGGGTHTSHVVMVPKTDMELQDFSSITGGVLNYFKTQSNTYSPFSESFNMPSV